MLRFGDITAKRSSPTLLLWGDRDDLIRLREFLLGLPTDSAPVSLTSQDGFTSADGTTVMVAATRGRTRLERTLADCPSWLWEISIYRLHGEYQSLIEQVAYREPGHRYLDPDDPPGGSVVVSRGEYPDDFLQRNRTL